MKASYRALLACIAILLGAPDAAAQWDPTHGQWKKSHPADLRVMTWNVEDGLCSTNPKVEGYNSWCALARIVAALEPDLLILQETGDNSGNGTGSGVDSVGDLLIVLSLFVRGGDDPFITGAPPVTAWVRKYAPGYDLPHAFVSAITDGFNRNVILSRHPFADLNGDTVATRSDMPFLFASMYAPGPNGGIRGFQHVEIDLPDDVYAGDLVLGNSHLKAGPNAGDHAQRVIAAQNIAYYLDYLYNGAGTGIPDPQGTINDLPPATQVLAAPTAIVTGGDWNEDELQNGLTRGPASWISQAEFPDAPFGGDGTDRDLSDMLYDDAHDLFNHSSATHGSSKLDHIAWQDSIATLRRAVVFYTVSLPPGAMPAEILGFPTPSLASVQASDHRPVIVDLSFPPARFTASPGGSIGAPPGKFP